MFRECSNGTGTKTDRTRTYHPALIYTYTSQPPTHPSTCHTSPTAIPTSATFRIPGLHCPTNFSPIHSFKNIWVCVHLLYRKLKECRGVHRKFERGLHPGCLQPIQVHLGHSVSPPMLSVELGGIFGTPKQPLFLAVYIASLHFQVLYNKTLLYTQTMQHTLNN